MVWASLQQFDCCNNSVLVAVVCGILGLLWFARQRSLANNTYLLDFSTCKPPADWVHSHEDYVNTFKNVHKASEEQVAFQAKLLNTNGVGDATFFPPGLRCPGADRSLKSAREEAEVVIFGVLDDLFAKTGVSPKEVDILIVNCSLFCPTPSLTAMIVNKYSLSHKIESYNLGGMGCSAGVIAIHLAHKLLKTQPNSIAVVVSTENITQNMYLGEEKSMQISNTLFRVGGAAIMLTNKPSLRSRSKFQLKHTVRTHMGSDELSYRAVFQLEDPKGVVGVKLDKSLMEVATRALTKNLTQLGPKILPWSEQMRYVISLAKREWWRLQNRRARHAAATGKPSEAAELEPVALKEPKLYTPDFRKAVDDFCIHAGGRAVIDAVEKALRLTPADVAPSRDALRTWGNTSSSSVWYELEFIEKRNHGRVPRGRLLWQIAFGSGFKCNSAIWEAI